jgi:DNA-binding NtrC family response regulator
MVAEKFFREDLYYRIAVVCIQSQPLRERREEIPQMAQHFLAKYARSFHKNVDSITPAAALLLREHSWPGNVRELENVIQSAIIHCDSESIGPADLPEELRRNNSATEREALRWESFEDQLRDYKTRLAMEAVRECNGNKKLAAQSLNISRTYLHRLLREPADERPALRVA